MSINGFEWMIDPPKSFMDEWKGTGEFLGTERTSKRSIEEWVLYAESLAREHGGILPHRNWMATNGHNSLCSAMHRSPDAFLHIAMENKHRTPEEWVAAAEALAKKHDGVLPSHEWLNANGYSGLRRIARKRPELFSHIPTSHRCKTPMELLGIAAELAENNNGFLPHSTRLGEMGFESIVVAMRKHPKVFSDIKQEFRRRGPNPQVVGYKLNGHVYVFEDSEDPQTTNG